MKFLFFRNFLFLFLTIFLLTNMPQIFFAKKSLPEFYQTSEVISYFFKIKYVFINVRFF